MQQTSGRRREKNKGITQSTIAHMASRSNIVYFVMEMGFVSTRNRNTLVLSVTKERIRRFTSGRIAHMARKSLFVYFVMELAFVSTRNINTIVLSVGRKKGIGQSTIVHMEHKSIFVYFVMVVGCAKPHTVLR